jgi:hypothetical protein
MSARLSETFQGKPETLQRVFESRANLENRLADGKITGANVGVRIPPQRKTV